MAAVTNATSGGSASQSPICAVQHIVKHYGGVKALVGVDWHVHPGTVHALVGENGAGKSTLMKILAGAEHPTSGTILLEGQPKHFRSVHDANAQGVAIVFQELSLFPDLDLLANLFMLREPRRFGIIQRGEMRRQAQPILDELGLDVPLDVPVSTLTLAERQLVEIAKALLLNSKILILDEPNSALNAAESERLFAIIRKLRERGVAIIYISHRLEEVFAISDWITVLRNGQIVMTTPREATAIPQVVAAMIGREVPDFDHSRALASAPAMTAGDALHLSHVTSGSAAIDISFTASPGEIVGLAGLEGAGVSATLEVIFGLRRCDSGTIQLPNGKPAPRSVSQAVRSDIAMVPSDRRSEGLMLDQPIMTNIAQVTAGALGRLGFFLRQRALDQRTQTRADALHIKADSVYTTVGNLSGGNQQKVEIAKWLDADPRVVLLNDPTRGVDVGAKEEIYRIIQQLADQGRIVLFTSTELPEFVHLCDRVLVFYRGRIVGEIARADLTTHRLLEAINTGVIH
jgi:ribose transport system ATP-binding protein